MENQTPRVFGIDGRHRGQAAAGEDRQGGGFWPPLSVLERLLYGELLFDPAAWRHYTRLEGRFIADLMLRHEKYKAKS